jgi:hypothetical protein
LIFFSAHFSSSRRLGGCISNVLISTPRIPRRFAYTIAVIFIAIVVSIVACNFLWWKWARRKGQNFKHARAWRIGTTIFAGLVSGYILLYIVCPPLARKSHLLPIPVFAWIYIWDLLVLPPTIIVVGIAWLWKRKKGRSKRNDIENPTPEPRTPKPDSSDSLSRRQWLSAAAVTMPPIIAAGIAGRAVAQFGRLRLRSIDVPIPNLPTPLDGLTIAHVSDIHIGKFTRKGMLDHVIEMTNQLRADLVIYTGDLIDLALADLPAGVDVINKLDAKLGLVMIEGNHDLIEDPDEFERRAVGANLPILLDQTRTLNIRGVPMQFLGIRWGRPDDGPRRKNNNVVIHDNVSALLPQRDPNAFQVLLTHHPHGFDTAIDAGIPLTLSGHTHGGQLMLTERLGAGPVMFKYWSGLYRRGNSSLVVSNGAGNWFPLRVNAPAEIGSLTLRLER